MFALLQLLLPLLLLRLQQAFAYNYCQNATSYCEMANTVHFMCRLETELRPLNSFIKLVAIIPDTYVFRDMILEYHNSFRDAVASGLLVNKNGIVFPSARRMRELVWDSELAYLSRMHVKSLSFKHTVCRSVKRFPLVGENLSLIFTNKTKHQKVRDVLNLTLKNMFLEYKDIADPEKSVDYFDIMQHPESLGHFTIMVNDRVSRVGCSLSIATHCVTTKAAGHCYFLCCHYDFNNVAGEYIYKRGRPCSGCNAFDTTPSRNYLNLCTNNGQIFAKDDSKVVTRSDDDDE